MALNGSRDRFLLFRQMQKIHNSLKTKSNVLTAGLFPIPAVRSDSSLGQGLGRRLEYRIDAAVPLLYASSARMRLTISIAPWAQSAPLLPALVPARSMACSMVSAGLQGHIQRGPCWGFPAGGESLSLGMKSAAAVVVALTDDAPILHDNGAHHGVGICPTPAPLRQFQSHAHIVQIVHGAPPTKKCLEQTVQGTVMRQRALHPWKNKSPGMKHIPEQYHGRRYRIPCVRTIFFHPDCTVGLGISPNHALRLVGFTTGGESHPALKILI